MVLQDMFNQEMKTMQKLWPEKFALVRLVLMEALGDLQRLLVALKPQGMEESMA
jgi:hypothetical protein